MNAPHLATRERMNFINRHLPFISLIALAIVLVTSIVGVGYAVSNNTTAEATKASQQIASCRSVEFATVIEAQAQLNDAQAALDLATNQGLQAILDKAPTGPIEAELPVLRATASEKSMGLADAILKYQNSAQESADNPAQFLRDCQNK